MGVDDVVAIDGCGVSGDRILCHGVGDLLAVCHGRKVRERVGPCPICSCLDLLPLNSGAVCQQVHHDGARTQAISVVVIVPGLGTLDCDKVRCIGVGDGVAADGGGVSSHRILGHCVGDLLAVIVLRKSGEAVAPCGGILCSADGCASNLCSVLPEPDCDVVRSYASLIVLIRPDLGAADVHCLGLVAVGDGKFPC